MKPILKRLLHDCPRSFAPRRLLELIATNRQPRRSCGAWSSSAALEYSTAASVRAGTRAKCGACRGPRTRRIAWEVAFHDSNELTYYWPPAVGCVCIRSYGAVYIHITMYACERGRLSEVCVGVSRKRTGTLRNRHGRNNQSRHTKPIRGSPRALLAAPGMHRVASE